MRRDGSAVAVDQGEAGSGERLPIGVDLEDANIAAALRRGGRHVDDVELGALVGARW